MNTTTTTTIPDVHIPAGAVRAEDWEPEGYRDRVFEGEHRYVNDSTTPVSVWTHGLQHTDGSIDNGNSREAPGISVSGVHGEDSINAEAAR